MIGEVVEALIGEVVEALIEEVEVTIEVAEDFIVVDTIEENVTLTGMATIRMALTSVVVTEIVVALEEDTTGTLIGTVIIQMEITNAVTPITKIKGKGNNKGKVEDITLQIIQDAIENYWKIKWYY